MVPCNVLQKLLQQAKRKPLMFMSYRVLVHTGSLDVSTTWGADVLPDVLQANIQEAMADTAGTCSKLVHSTVAPTSCKRGGMQQRCMHWHMLAGWNHSQVHLLHMLNLQVTKCTHCPSCWLEHS